jgi:hypothetical protein
MEKARQDRSWRQEFVDLVLRQSTVEERREYLRLCLQGVLAEVRRLEAEQVTLAGLTPGTLVTALQELEQRLTREEHQAAATIIPIAKAP